MWTSTVAVADALPAQPAIVIGDSTVERSGICPSALLLATHPAGPGDGDGLAVGVGDGDGVALAVGDGVGLGEGVGDGVGVAPGSTVNDRVSADEPLPARSIVYIENV